MSKIIYATDIHGNVDVYEKMLEIGRRSSIKAIVIGGDITPGFDVYMQRFFLEKYLIPRLTRFRDAYKKEVFIMMGNDDFKVNINLLHAAEEVGIIHILYPNKVHSLFKDIKITGYPFINPTPFALKDWEKEESEIKDDLNRLKKISDPKKTIYVFHAPPFETNLDITYSGHNVGSISIRSFIEKEQPFLTLHGHIHESPGLSGFPADVIGKTLCINPGNARIISIDLNKPESIEFF